MSKLIAGSGVKGNLARTNCTENLIYCLVLLVYTEFACLISVTSYVRRLRLARDGVR